jgi:hypothetical protein
MHRQHFRFAQGICITGLFVVCGWLPTVARATITLGQIDNFEDGTTQNWQEGSSPNPPTNVATGGPAGVGDHYLNMISSGIGSAGGKQVDFNRTQWAGDYLTAGVDRVSAMIANFGGADVTMRLSFERNFGERYSTTAGVVVPADGLWHAVAFDITPADLTNVGGAATASDVLAATQELRILAASAGPTWFGDQIQSSIGVDNITALPEPASVGLLALGALFALRRRR